MNHHVIIGAGPVGSGIAALLAGRGESVTVVTRSGTGPDHALITKLKADATDADALVLAASGTTAIYNCANPPYHKWASDWPPMHRAMMTAAERSGAVLVMMDNLYAFGSGSRMPMHEGDAMNAIGTKGAMRARMARELLEAHATGRLRGTLARASDFYGPQVLGSSLGKRVLPRVLAGKKVSMLGALNVPHSISYIADVTTTLVTIAEDERAWGKPWHVPNAPAPTQHEAVHAFATAAGTTVKVTAVAKPALSALGLFVPMMRELKETWYQYAEPWITDSMLTEQTFGLCATPLEEGAAATVAWWRGRS